jgi:hypothetical protein
MGVSDFTASESLLAQCPRKEFSELCEEYTIGDKLSLLAEADVAGGHGVCLAAQVMMVVIRAVLPIRLD